MKTKILTLALVTLGLQNLIAQVTQTREVATFTKIQASGVAKIIYTHADTLKLSVKGEENEVTFLDTKVEDGTLYITAKGNYKESIRVYVSNNKLNEVLLSGAVNLETKNALKTDNFNISLSGASSANIELNATKVSAIQSGASNLKLNGSTESFSAENSGASSLKAYGLNSKLTSVTTTGASSAKVFASEKLVANATGASSIKFKGEAKDVTAEASTSSSITKIVDDNTKEDTGRNDSIIRKKNGDSVVINIRSRRIIIFDKDDKKVKLSHTKTDDDDFKHWRGLALGVNGYLTPDADFSMTPRYNYMSLNYGRSINVQWNIVQRNWHIYKNYVNLVSGFGIEWRRYMLDNKTTLNADSSFTWGTIDSTNTFKYTKNLFRSTMLQVPLLVEFNTNKNPKKAFHIATGVIGQFMVGSRLKQEFERNNDEFEKNRKDNYNLSPFTLKAHASMGYSSFTAFGEYNLTSLFEKGKGPQLYPFVIGIRVLPW